MKLNQFFKVASGVCDGQLKAFTDAHAKGGKGILD